MQQVDTGRSKLHTKAAPGFATSVQQSALLHLAYLQVREEVARMRRLDEQLQAKTLEATMVARETAPGAYAAQERARLQAQRRRLERRLARARADHDRQCAAAVLHTLWVASMVPICMHRQITFLLAFGSVCIHQHEAARKAI